MTRVRVGIISPSLWRGGAEQWMLSLIEHCDSAQIDWLGVAVRYEQHAHGPMHAALRRRVSVAVGPEALDALYAQADVVLLWGVGTGDQRVPPRPRSCRVALVSHGVGHWTARVFERPDEADVLLGVSPAAVSPIPLEYRQQSRVILNCYEPARIVPTGQRAALRAAWGVRPGETVVGYLGRISVEKNPEALIHLATASPDVRGVLVGSGGTEHLRRMAEHRGVADRIAFHGEVRQPGDVLSAFDWLLLPSHEEACSITLLEAWAAGVPAIATPVGVVTEHPDLVRLVVASPTGEQLADALARDRANPDEVQARLDRARQVATMVYSPARFGREWTEFLVSQANLLDHRALRARRDVFANVPPSPQGQIGRAAACAERSHKHSWHARCLAGVGGLSPHHVVGADDCCACLDGRGECS